MAYENATYYDCRGNESLEHETPEDTIAELIECYLEPGCDVARIIEERGPITVTAYKRNEVSESWIRNTAEYLAGDAAERFCEEYGNPDGDTDDVPEEAVKRAAEFMEAGIRAMAQAATVWQCETCGERTYQPAEVEALMRAERSEWFETEAPASVAT